MTVKEAVVFYERKFAHITKKLEAGSYSQKEVWIKELAEAQRELEKYRKWAA